jgi:hypothetical protein
LDNQPLTFVLPISSDEQLTVDDLFNLKSKLSSALKFDTGENIQRLKNLKEFLSYKKSGFVFFLSRDKYIHIFIFEKKYIPHLFM